jgi:ribonuclease HI
MARPSKSPAAAGLFPADAPAPEKSAAHRMNIDGGSRGNPGPASYGVVVRDARGQIVAQLKKYIGRTTNNVAEYYGLIAALDYAQAHGIRALQIESDSELLVKQMRGQYKVKSEDLRPLFERAKKMSATFDTFGITHVYREKNQEADALANEALDETAAGAASAPSSSSPSAPGAAPAKPGTRTRPEKPAAPGGADGSAEKPPPGGRADSSGEKSAAGTKPAPAAGSAPAVTFFGKPKPDTSGVPRKVRARYRSGILYPLEDLDLEDGIEVEIYLRATPKKEKL